MRHVLTAAAARRLLSLLVALAALLAAATAAVAAVPSADAQRIVDRATASLGRSAAKLGARQYPQVTSSAGQWQTTGASDWTSGFFPGSLWLMYDRTHDALWKQQAI